MFSNDLLLIQFTKSMSLGQMQNNPAELPVYIHYTMSHYFTGDKSVLLFQVSSRDKYMAYEHSKLVLRYSGRSD